MNNWFDIGDILITPAIIGAGGLDGSDGDQGTAIASDSVSDAVGPLNAFNNSVTNEDRWQSSTSYGTDQWIRFDVGTVKKNIDFIVYGLVLVQMTTRRRIAASALPRDWRIEGSMIL